MSIKLFLVDDHQIVTDSLAPLLNNQPDLEVVGVAEDGRSAIKALQTVKADVVVMDIVMPELNGIEATRQMLSQYPELKVIILSMHSDRQYVTGVFSVGASGYLTKSCSLDELINAIRIAYANKKYVSPEISDIVIEESLHQAQESTTPYRKILTPREREVLQLLSEGKTVKEIAYQLYISEKTVHVHRKQIMEKLDIHNIANLTKYAIREGLTSLKN